MKQWPPSFWVVLCAAFLATALPACEEEVCGAENCPGICYENECLTESEYIEALGPAFFRAYYIGAWESGQICPAGSEVGNISVGEGTGSDEILFSTLGPEYEPVRATVFGTSITIPEQIYANGSISGSGGIDTTAGEITLDYTMDQGNGPFSCLTTLQTP